MSSLWWEVFSQVSLDSIFKSFISNHSGKLLKIVGKHQITYKKGQTILKLALNIGNVMTPGHNLPKDALFDDDAYFYKEDDKDELIYHANGINNKGFLA